MTKRLFVVLLCLGVFVKAHSGDGSNSGSELILGGNYTVNVIQTPVPFINIAPDSRAGAMGDLGAATSPDLSSMHWNAAKYAFLDDELGLGITYSPWLKSIASDIHLLYATGFMRLDKQQTLAASLRYFSLGQIIFTNELNEYIGQKNPSELTLDAAYSRLFSDKLSGGITFRLIYSDLSVGSSSGNEKTKAGIAFASDISTYYRTPITLDGKSGEWAFGFCISNMGSKISYTESAQKDFIPTNLRIGTSVSLDIDPYNSITLATDLNKLLVPTPPIYAIDTLTNGPAYDKNGKKIILHGMDPEVSVAQGMLQSFYDAPGGASEEFKEIMISLGAEYWYHKQFAVRGGYFNEAAMKGNRKYFTLGLGLKLTGMGLDFSYLVPSSGRNNPLANTMRLSLYLEIGKPKKTNQK